MSDDEFYHNTIRYDLERQAIAAMFQPVRCGYCHNVYDLGAVQVLDNHFKDCVVWRTPCCNRQVDDRPAGWNNSSVEGYTRIER